MRRTTFGKLLGWIGFARIRKEQPGATVFGPAIEQISQAGHEAGAAS